MKSLIVELIKEVSNIKTSTKQITLKDFSIILPINEIPSLIVNTKIDSKIGPLDCESCHNEKLFLIDVIESISSF